MSMLPLVSYLLLSSATARAQEETTGEADPAVAQEGAAERPGKGKRRRGPKGGDGRPAGPDGGGALADLAQPYALVQIWGTAYDQDEDPQADATGYGDPESDPGVGVKRARIGLEGRHEHFEYEVIFGITAPYDAFDAEDGDIQLVDANVGYVRKGFGFTLGRTKVPFSRDQMMSSGELTFTERGLGAEHVAPDRAMGAVVDAGGWGGKLSLGVFNSGGDLFGDEVATGEGMGKTMVGRLEYERGGDSYRTWSRNKDLVYGLGGGGFISEGVATKTTGVGGDILVRWMGASLLFDAAWSSLEPAHTIVGDPDVWTETTRLALTGEVSYAVGPFQPAVRYTRFDDSSVGEYAQLLGGVTWHGLYGGDPGDKTDHMRLGLGYVHRWEPTARDNDTVRLWAQFRL